MLTDNCLARGKEFGAMKCCRYQNILLALTGCFLMIGLNAASVVGAEDLNRLPVDFLIKVDVAVEGGDAYAKAANIVDNICSFRLATTEPGASALRYDIAMYRNGSLVKTWRDRPLPVTLKRAYRGVVDGDYTITFVATDDVGRIGKGSAMLRVRH